MTGELDPIDRAIQALFTQLRDAAINARVDELPGYVRRLTALQARLSEITEAVRALDELATGEPMNRSLRMDLREAIERGRRA